MILLKIIGAFCVLISIIAFAVDIINSANEDAFLREKERYKLKEEHKKSDPK